MTLHISIISHQKDFVAAFSDLKKKLCDKINFIVTHDKLDI